MTWVLFLSTSHGGKMLKCGGIFFLGCHYAVKHNADSLFYTLADESASRAALGFYLKLCLLVLSLQALGILCGKATEWTDKGHKLKEDWDRSSQPGVIMWKRVQVWVTSSSGGRWAPTRPRQSGWGTRSTRHLGLGGTTALIFPRTLWSGYKRIYSVISQFSHSVVPDSLWPHGLQHPRLPWPSPTPGACSHSCPLSRQCHPTISSSVVPFSFCLQSFPASGSFLESQFFASGGQRIGVSASTSVIPMNIQDWFPLGGTGWISLQSKGLSRVIPNTTIQKHQFFGAQLSL